MLEFTYYNTEKIDNLKDLFTIIFVLVDDIYNEIIPPTIKNRRNISDSKLSDSEIILKRKNSKNPLENQLRNTLSKTRRRVETSFSQLASQFNINKVLAKSRWGLMLRITLKILAHNILFIINNILENKETAQIKQLVFG